MEDIARVLTLMNYGDEGEVARVTVAGHNVQAVIASDKDEIVQGQIVRKVNVLFIDGGNLGLNISLMDLTTLEQAIGTYFIP